MKFTGFAVSLALAGMVSAAAIPGIPGASGAVAGLEGAAKGTLAGLASREIKRGEGDALAGATEGVASSLNGVTGIAGSAAGTVESTTSNAAYTGENLVSGAVPVHKHRDMSGVTGNTVPSLGSGALGSVAGTAGHAVPETSGATGGLVKRILPGAGNVAKASVENDLAMLSGNPSGLIGALGGLHSALASHEITSGQIAALPTALQEVVAYLYTA
ncbi:uncharacterized protein N7459_000956 [Penicillium hispanicum]|uniref:uncharacterized protein n=1 Tax=Penicillium hispanicum TaxID=1080232 RepID=UPI0025421B33|nr:uncharacterized protein N7459_000956 [Penicillium hispanicum]KAJ5594748.1 hypothetical protein N7459_000956 [Penicillium hispanicum]